MLYRQILLLVASMLMAITDVFSVVSRGEGLGCPGCGVSEASATTSSSWDANCWTVSENHILVPGACHIPQNGWCSQQTGCQLTLSYLVQIAEGCADQVIEVRVDGAIIFRASTQDPARRLSATTSSGVQCNTAATTTVNVGSESWSKSISCAKCAVQ
jgi:hypothetical protein